MNDYFTSLKHKAEDAEAVGDYLSAIESYLKALKALEDKKGIQNTSKESVTISQRLASLYTEIGDFESSITYYTRAIAAHKGHIENLIAHLLNVGDFYSKIGILTLAKSDYKNVIEAMDDSFKYYDQAIEFVSDDQRPKLVARYILNLLIKILSLFRLGNEPEETMPLLKKAVGMNTEYKIQGYLTDFSLLLLYLLKDDTSNAYKILKNQLMTVVDPLGLGYIYHSIVQCAVMQLAIKNIPTIQVQADDPGNIDKGEVLLTQKNFEDMLLYGLAYANRQMEKVQYKEVLALVVGKIEKSKVKITGIVPMVTGTEQDVAFKDEHYAKAEEINLEAAKRNEFIIGWFHTHPGLGLFLSPTDIINQLGYQTLNEKAIALLFDFTQATLDNSGFAVFRLIEPTFQSGYYLTPWRIIDAPRNFHSYHISLLSKFTADLNHILQKDQEISLAQLAVKLDRSEHLLEQIMPQFIKLKYLPKTRYNPETKMILRTE